MSKSEIKSRVKQIEKSFDQTNRLSADDVNFLKQLAPKNKSSYYSAHRVLGAFYFNLGDRRRQRDSLAIATKKGRYRSDPKVLLSLGQSYGHFKQYSKAIPVLRRAEAKMGRLDGRGKAMVYRTYAEYLRLNYISQKARNPLQADANLLDTAIQKWRRLQSLSGAGSRDGLDANKQIKKLETLKSEASRRP